MKTLVINMKHIVLLSLTTVLCLFGQVRTGCAQQPSVDERLKEIQSLIDVRKDFDGALRGIEEVFKIDPNNALAYKYRGLVDYTKSNYEQALADYNRALELNPNLDLFYFRGLAYEYKPHPDDKAAENDFKAAVKLNPNYAAVYNELGRIYMLRKSWSDAIDNFNRAIKLGAGNALIYQNHGYVQYMSGNYPQAITDYRKALTSDPNSPWTKDNLTLAIAAQKQTLDQIQLDRFVAVELPADALPNESPETLAAFARAVKLINAGSFAAAQDILNEVSVKEPNNAGVFYYQSIVAYKNTDCRVAVDSATEAIAVNPKVAEFYQIRGIATLYDPDGWHTEIGETAVKDFNKALELNPNYADAYRERGVVQYYFVINVPNASSFGDWRLAVKLNPTDGEAHFLVGLEWSNFIKEWQNAERELTLAINNGTARSAVYEARGYANFKLNNRTQAIADYQKAVELNPNNALAIGNLRKLNANAKDIDPDRRYREVDPYKNKMREIFHRYGQALGNYNSRLTITPTNQQDSCNKLHGIFYDGEIFLSTLLELRAAVRTEWEKAAYLKEYQDSYKTLEESRITLKEELRACNY